MSVVVWIVLFAAATAVCAWIALGNGTETFSGLLTALLLGADVANWSESGIRLVIGATWVLLAIWFVLGLLEPAARFDFADVP